jgi:hypothetical protein
MIQKLPITEKEISQWTEKPIHSPILCASIDDLGISGPQFIKLYADCFCEMPWDWYDVKREQWESLPSRITQQDEAANVFTEYYLNPKATLEQFCESLDLGQAWKAKLRTIRPSRRRSVCCFEVELGEDVVIRRVAPRAFKQEVDKTDLRSLPRVFEQTKTDLVENELFHGLLRGIAQLTQRVTPHVSIDALKVSAHFMSVRASQSIQGRNAPEGPHEDGADFIVSALVINRTNISGGTSQVFERMQDGRMVKIFERELQPGEFIFQADTGEEKHYGNDLWHYVTPFAVLEHEEQGKRDIIGMDVSIVRGNVSKIAS